MAVHDIADLLGMIQEGKIWATHVSRLNDSSEYHHGIKIGIEQQAIWRFFEVLPYPSKDSDRQCIAFHGLRIVPH